MENESSAGSLALLLDIHNGMAFPSHPEKYSVDSANALQETLEMLCSLGFVAKRPARTMRAPNGHKKVIARGTGYEITHRGIEALQKLNLI